MGHMESRPDPSAPGHRDPLRQRGRVAARDRADPRPARAPRRRGQAVVRRPAARRLARERRAAAPLARRPGAHDPPLPPAWVRTKRPRRTRHAGFAAARLPRTRGRGALDPADLRPGGLAGFGDPAERVVTIEDAAELRLALPHVVRLESRPPNLEGRGEVTIRRLVRNALRMRPDRLIVGEVRGPEALDLLVALSTGHAGSLCTIHAGSAAEALRRLETLALMADVGLPLVAIRDQIADAIDLIVRQERGADGTRRVVEVAEVVRVAGGPAGGGAFPPRAGPPPPPPPPSDPPRPPPPPGRPGRPAPRRTAAVD